MFLIKDPKKEAASIVLAVGKPEPKEGGGDESKLVAADSLLMAVEKKDPKAVVMAFEDLYALCCTEEASEEEGEME